MAWTLLAVLVVTALLVATGYQGAPFPAPSPPTALASAFVLGNILSTEQVVNMLAQAGLPAAD